MIYQKAALEELKNLYFNNDWSTIVDHRPFWSNITVGRAQRVFLDIGIYAINGDGMCGYPITLGTFSDRKFTAQTCLSAGIPRWWYTNEYYNWSVFALPEELSVFPNSYDTKENKIHYNWNGVHYEISEK